MSAYIAKIETFFDSLGLMRGSSAIMKRGVFGALFAGFLITYLKPGIMFSDGKARPWSLLSDDPDATMIPWYIVPLIGAIFSSVFI